MWNSWRRPELRGLIPQRVPAPGQRPGEPRRNKGNVAAGSRKGPPATDSEDGGAPRCGGDVTAGDLGGEAERREERRGGGGRHFTAVTGS